MVSDEATSKTEDRGKIFQSAVFQIGEIGDVPEEVAKRIGELAASGELEKKIAAMMADADQARERATAGDREEGYTVYPQSPYGETLMECIGRPPVIISESESDEEFSERASADSREIWAVLDGLPYLVGWERAEAYLRIANIRSLIVQYNDVMHCAFGLLTDTLSAIYGDGDEPMPVSPSEIGRPDALTEMGVSIATNLTTACAITKMVEYNKGGILYFVGQLDRRAYLGGERFGGDGTPADGGGDGGTAPATGTGETTGDGANGA